MNQQRRSFRLSTFISFLLVVTTAVTMALVGGIILVYRIPQINSEAKDSVQRDAADKAKLLELTLSSLESQLKPLVALTQFSAPDATAVTSSLQVLVGEGEQFIAVYVVDSVGIIQDGRFSRGHVAGTSFAGGGDLSRTPLFLAAQEGKSVWSDKYLSAQSGNLVVGVAQREGFWTVIGEIAPQYLRDNVSTVAGRGGDQVLVVDRTGEYIADSNNEYSPTVNLGDLSVVKAMLSGQDTGQEMEHHARSVFVGSAKPEKFGWTFIVTRPAGMDNPDIRRTVIVIVAGFAGSLFIGLLLAPWWSRSLSRPIQRMIDRTHQYAEGNYEKTDGPDSRVLELNAFGNDLQRMAEAIHSREAEIRRSEERLRATLESTPSVAIQWYDINGRVLHWNKASELIYGFTSHEAVGSIVTENPLIYLDRKQAEDFVAVLEQIDRTEQPIGPAEFDLHKKDGNSITMLATIFSIPGDDGNKIYVCMDVDVTEQKRAEAALIDNKKKLEAIFNASPAAMSVSDVSNNFKVIAVNAAWGKQFRRQRQHIVGLNGLEMGLWADSSDRDHFMATLSGGKSIDMMEAELLTGDGQRLLCSISAQIIEIGEFRLLLMMTIDITERRRIEIEIHELNVSLEARVINRTDELSRKNMELAATLDNLRRTKDELLRTEKLASLGALVAGIAHELNTPLGNAVTLSSTLLDEQKNFVAQLKAGITRSELNAFVSTVGEAGQILDRNLLRAADLVTSFKQLAVDQSSYQRRQFDLAEVVREITLAMGPAIRKTPHKVHNEVSQGLLLDSYPGPLGQVLMNMINNALIHAFEGKDFGNICIQAMADQPGWIDLVVSDDGCGIPVEHQKRIFDPFFTTRLGQGGSGLGLHIVFNLVVDVLGGRIDITSVPGQGCIFHLRIPSCIPETHAFGYGK